MAMERVQKRRHIGEVILIWPSTSVPPHIRELIDKIKAVYGARVVAIKVRPSDVDKLLSYTYMPEEEVPEVHRSLVEYMRYHGIRDLPALIVDNKLVAAGEGEVVEALKSLLYNPAIA